MAEFRRAGDEQINVFEIDETYLFKHYFDGEDVFDRLKPYYNNQQYRFEVPAEAFEELRSFLSDHGYSLAIIDAVREFAVVVKKYTEHPENIFKGSVIHRSVDGYNAFLMTDQAAVDRAIREGAIRLSNTAFENPF
jgi:hypothetical protein